MLVVLALSLVVLLAAGLSCYFFYLYLQYVLTTFSLSGTLSPESTKIISDLFFDMLWLIGFVELIILFGIALLSLNYLFKVTGAEYAIARHIRENMVNENWETLHLRKGDALTSIAEELNQLSAKQSTANHGEP